MADKPEVRKVAFTGAQGHAEHLRRIADDLEQNPDSVEAVVVLAMYRDGTLIPSTGGHENHQLAMMDKLRFYILHEWFEDLTVREEE